MATENTVRFYSVNETAFYFEDVEEDSFFMSPRPVHQHFIQSNDNKFLVLNAEELQGKNLTTQQQSQPECKFCIQMYNNSAQEGLHGRAVMLYANKDGRKMVISCNDKREIHPVQMNPPSNIKETANRALFYMRELSTSKHMFESSWYPSQFLGFDDGDDNLKKLVLLYQEKDEVDESVEITISPCNK